MKTIKHLIAITLALVCLIGAVALVMSLEKSKLADKDNQKKQQQPALLPVSVIPTPRISHHATFTLYGEVKPRWRTTIKAKKRAQVRTISSQLAVGKTIRKGSTLITFDNESYNTRVAEIKYQIAQAELLIMDEQQKAKLARSDWRLAGRRGGPSEFALRKPQLKAAFAQLNLAKVQLNETEKTANYATLIAPYDSVVVSRTVNKGDLVSEGQGLAEVISANELEISLKLDEQQWQMLGNAWQGQTVSVSPSSGESSVKWTASIDRADGLIDSQTRLRALYLSVNSLEKPLAGSLVSVEATGKKLTGLLKIPQAALTPDGYVWFVDEQQQLNRFAATSAFSDKTYLFVKAPTDTNQTQFNIVRTPLSSFLAGIKVNAKQAEK